MAVRPERRCDGPGPPRSGKAIKGASDEGGDAWAATGAPGCVQAGIVTGLWRYPDASVLKVAGRHRHARAGVYGSTIRPGLVRVGDPVTIA